MQSGVRVMETEIETDDQHIATPHVEGVTIHIEPMNDHRPEAGFVVRLAVNGVIQTSDTWYGITNAAIPKTVADLLKKGATRWAGERPDWISRAMVSTTVGAFRKLFQREDEKA